MTSSKLRRPPSAATNGTRPVTPPPGATTPTRSAPMALAGLTAIVVGALAFAGLHIGLDRRQSVLVVARPVAAGALITPQDIGQAKVSVAPSMALPANHLDQVVGKPAATALLPGSLLAPGQIGASSALRPGEALVGLALKTGQFPPAVRAGSRVEVVDTGRASGQSDQARPVVLSATAVVTSLGRPEASTSTTALSLSVPEPEAAGIVAAGAAGRASLVVLPAP